MSGGSTEQDDEEQEDLRDAFHNRRDKQIFRMLSTIAVPTHSSNARAVAEHFAENRARFGLADVRYPGLPDHPGHEIAARQMSDFGAIVTIEVAGGEARANEVLKRTSLFQFAVSLGGVESLIQHPASLTHKAVPEAERAAAGISGGMIRLSVGIEACDELIADVGPAMKDVGKNPNASRKKQSVAPKSRED